MCNPGMSTLRDGAAEQEAAVKAMTKEPTRTNKLMTPEQQLCAAFAYHAGVAVPPGKLRAFLIDNWDEVARLAHAIHGEGRTDDSSAL